MKDSAAGGNWSPVMENAPINVESCSIDWVAELNRHQRWLRTVVFARVGDADAVDDVMQEVTLAVIAGKNPLRDRTRLAAWLYQITLRQTVLYRRRLGRIRRRHQTWANQNQLRGTTRTDDGPLGWLLANERRQLLGQALARLTGSEREILLLKYVEDWGYREIAEHLDISTAAVESRLHRARGRLRKQLEHQERNPLRVVR